MAASAWRRRRQTPGEDEATKLLREQLEQTRADLRDTRAQLHSAVVLIARLRQQADAERLTAKPGVTPTMAAGQELALARVTIRRYEELVAAYEGRPVQTLVLLAPTAPDRAGVS